MASPSVRIASELAAEIQADGLDPQDLISDFQDWKAGQPDDSYIFGWDVLGIGSTYLYHAHMVPLNVKADLVTWDNAWSLRGRRTSDRYLFYADGGAREGFLLVAVIDDPGAHLIWQAAYKSMRDELEHIAEQFCVYGIVP